MTKDEIERVARAIEDAGHDWGLWDNADLAWRRKCLNDLSQSVAQALRQPTEPPADTVRVRVAVAHCEGRYSGAYALREGQLPEDGMLLAKTDTCHGGRPITHECIATIDVPAVPDPAEVVGVVE